MNLYNWQIHITKTNKQTLNEKRNKNDSKLKHKQKQNETKKKMENQWKIQIDHRVYFTVTQNINIFGIMFLNL